MGFLAGIIISSGHTINTESNRETCGAHTRLATKKTKPVVVLRETVGVEGFAIFPTGEKEKKRRNCLVYFDKLFKD